MGWISTDRGEADGEVLLSYVVMFHKMRLLDLYKTLKK